MNSRTFQWQFVTFFRFLFATHLLYSGGAYIFFGWVPSAMSDPLSPVGQFMAALDKIGLYPLVKYIEFTLGLLALSNRFTPLAAVMEFPILWSSPISNSRCRKFACVAAFLYRRTGTADQWHRAAGLWWILSHHAQHAQRTRLAVGNAKPGGKRRSMARTRRSFWHAADMDFFILFMIVIMAASWFLGSAARRLPPRDWLPPLRLLRSHAGACRFWSARRAASNSAFDGEAPNLTRRELAPQGWACGSVASPLLRVRRPSLRGASRR